MKYYKIKEHCIICDNYVLQSIPKLYHVTVRMCCDLDPDKELPERLTCEKFKPCELLEEL